MRASHSPYCDSSLRVFFLVTLAAAMVAGIPGAPALAQSSGSITLTLEPEATQVNFFLEATGHDVQGSLAFDSGRLTLEPMGTDGGVARGELVIDARRAETGHRKRDRKMHGKVLESELFPQIVFHAERFIGEFPGREAGEIRLIGEMEALGVRHPMELPVSFEVKGSGFTAQAVFGVPFVEWGLEDPSFFIFKVAKVVEVTVHTSGIMEIAKPGSITSVEAEL